MTEDVYCNISPNGLFYNNTGYPLKLIYELYELNKDGTIQLSKSSCTALGKDQLLKQLEIIVANRKIYVQIYYTTIGLSVALITASLIVLAYDNYRKTHRVLPAPNLENPNATASISALPDRERFPEYFPPLDEIDENPNYNSSQLGNANGFLSELVGGKNNKKYKKTAEKYGRRCIYVSNRNAKYLKIKGEFVAYKTAIKMLNK